MKFFIACYIFIAHLIVSSPAQNIGWHTDIKSALKYPDKVIKLRCNNLDTLTGEISKFRNLEELDLSLSTITSIPKEIGDLHKLKRLKAWHCNLTSIPKEIGYLANLTYLDLGENKITALPREIGRLKSLKSLNLENNRLQSLPKEIGFLTELEFIDIHANFLTTLPPCIGDLSKLRFLILGGDYGGNPIAYLPAQISNLHHLQSLVLKDCMISELPEGILSMHSLRYVDLRGTPITKEHLHVEKAMKKMEVVLDPK